MLLLAGGGITIIAIRIANESQRTEMRLSKLHANVVLFRSKEQLFLN